MLEVLKEKKALKDQTIERVVFNAITKQAVSEAMKNPREIDRALVDAYLARRALDYLVGFTLSPVLWRKLPGARSAGRVQSVALRLVCDRELEIEKFVAARILVAGRQARDPARRHLRGAPRRRRRQEDHSASISAPAQEADDFKQALETRGLHGRSVEAKPAQAQSAAALHHLDHAAGSEPQARLRARAHHAARAAAL